MRRHRLLPVLAAGMLLALLNRGEAVVTPAALKEGADRSPQFSRHELERGVELDSAVAADFTGDGRPDVVAAGPKWMALHERTADGWKRRVIRTVSDKQKSLFSITLQAVDMDRDSDLDILTCDPHANTLEWFENPGTSVNAGDAMWPHHLIDRLPKVHSQALQDLDGDGKPELVANVEGRLVYYALPDRIREAGPYGDAAAPGSWVRKTLTEDGVEGTPHYLRFARLGDRLRLLTGAPDAGYIGWWDAPAQPGGVWSRRVLRPMPGASHLIPTDVNRDGETDLVYIKGHTTGIGWLAGPRFETDAVIDADRVAEPHAADVADVDGDGAPDVIAAARKSGGLHLWHNNGRGAFTASPLDPIQLGLDLRATDVDRDGDLDILVAGGAGNNLVWYENLKRRP